MIPATHVPPLGEIAAALRKTTERLAREVAEPRAAPPDWTGLEWGVARAAVSMQGIAFLLATKGSSLEPLTGPFRATVVLGASAVSSSVGDCGTHAFPPRGCSVRRGTLRCR